MTTFARLLAAVLMLLPVAAQAWWNADWKQRTAVILNTSDAGVPIHDTLAGVAVPIRLHSGNFDFVGAKADGSDLRVVAADDRTPLKFWVERYDSVDELAVLWVQVPSILPTTDKNVIYVYAGNDKAPADGGAAATASAVADGATLAAFHFAEKDGIAADQSGTLKATAAVAIEPNGLIGPSAHLTGTPITWPASATLKIAAAAPFSLSVWVRPEAAAGTLYAQGPLQLLFSAGKLTAKLGSASVTGGDVPPAAWSQVMVTSGSGKLTLYVNGAEAGQADLAAPSPAIDGDARAGEGYQGLMDELEIAGTVRSGDWIKLSYAAQSADAKLIASKTETADSAGSSSGSTSYFGILFKSLTPDAWTIIGILGVMFLIAVAVMIGKSFYVRRTDKANQAFLSRFRDSDDVLALGSDQMSVQFEGSSLYRLYRAGMKELVKRKIGQGDHRLSGPSLDAVKASIDADSVREGYALNSQMVLLTIAIAGGPFLGLLGTVVGVMITFASIAAAGDVNVNAIAPGIAAALLATVAGLSVAIPSLFGYNYLASRIKTISSDMQIFIDEFVTRVAESYGVT
jgi:biopolymer transport protein ExbB